MTGDRLDESVARAASRQARVSLRVGQPENSPDWVKCAELLSDASRFDGWRDRLAGWLRDQYGEAPERTVSGYLMTWYLSVPGYLAALLFHHERRVPSLRPEHLAFRMARPRPHPDAIAVLDRRFVCLPDDPAAGTPDATVVPDERALAAVLRGRFTAHAARFVTTFAPSVRFGRHTLWAAATDALDDSMLLAGRYGGDEGAGVVDGALLLPDRFAPLTSASTMRPGDGGTGWTRRRESCCFHYLIESGKGPCATCPRVLPR
ncbi:(2Fe-2S)-binding protein [Actinophytocola xanthii]|uniref:Iron-sulfur protein n=1 Tax=Actinophytocola xanthii TaxID=1912961 RepID=A0A1Q8C0S7_9PSEU|nr:(2Fe-2S)-binding protein [Actinophytocola xanthii]OLF07966.1 iron-sulfur protein [Actinophytocola xanthii]